MNTSMILLITTAVIAVAAIVWILVATKHSAKLRSKFGPEYDRLVEEEGDRRRAEAELERREHRVERLQFRTLTREESDRFTMAWRIEQQRFIDDPHGAVTRADALIGEVMQANGYPAGSFEERAADISVGHSKAVQHYRAAHEIVMRDLYGKTDTESLRVAMQHYRQLFEELMNQRQLAESRK